MGRLLKAYRTLIPERIRAALPHRPKIYAKGMLFWVTQHHDLEFQYMRHLHNKRRKNGPLAPNVNPKRIETAHGNKPKFTLWSKLYPIGSNRMRDPLFDCTLGGVASPGQFNMRFGYLGLIVSGEVSRDPDTHGHQPDCVDIMLDGHVLRSERLIYTRKKAKFSFVIKRMALDMFPRLCQLSVRTSHHEYLTYSRRYMQAVLNIPHGDGSIFARLKQTGPLDKKGWPRLRGEVLRSKQDACLDLYTRARKTFEEEFGKPLFLLYGTLLGQHRDGDFIPGDDDFDVGYVSELTSPEAIKAEAIAIMERLVECGFIVLLNRRGKPFRLRDAQSGAELHLDARPVFTRNDGHVWMHRLARLEMELDDFRQVEIAHLRQTDIYKPRGTEAFLAAYYGPGWRVPDPSFSNSSKVVDADIIESLNAICLTLAEQRALKSKLDAKARKSNGAGEFIPIRLQRLYPLEGQSGSLRDNGL